MLAAAGDKQEQVLLNFFSIYVNPNDIHIVLFEWEALIHLAQQVVHNQEKVGVDGGMAVEAEYPKNDLYLPILPPPSVLGFRSTPVHFICYIIQTGSCEGDTIIHLIP